ncbi:peptidase inhibitor family I36 [Actinophytocola oryzae]|uniref:Peptidase inhibitor family I36 n=2 Tax=Actinophytocola oryzae TaxID=502181 RepID=A0A4R7W4Q3_9PSEU|nr:peptidase inhibitor family I36 [Actinophytocola oryzae]
MRKTLCVLVSVLAALFAVAGTASAAEPGTADYHVAPTGELTVLAWECAAGDLCVWDGAGGTGNRCSWTNADNDWWSTPTVCSWADDRPVKSIYNRGQSTNYLGVNLYSAANYASSSRVLCAWQGTQWEANGTGVKMRSHRWTSSDC